MFYQEFRHEALIRYFIRSLGMGLWPNMLVLSGV